jgi:hypothetical protein
MHSFARVYVLGYGAVAISHILIQMLLAHLEFLRQRPGWPGTWPIRASCR